MAVLIKFSARGTEWWEAPTEWAEGRTSVAASFLSCGGQDLPVRCYVKLLLASTFGVLFGKLVLCCWECSFRVESCLEISRPWIWAFIRCEALIGDRWSCWLINCKSIGGLSISLGSIMSYRKVGWFVQFEKVAPRWVCRSVFWLFISDFCLKILKVQYGNWLQSQTEAGAVGYSTWSWEWAIWKWCTMGGDLPLFAMQDGYFVELPNSNWI